MDLAAVSSREIDSNVLTLSASGWTYFSTFVLYDYETESMWFPLSGGTPLICVSGFYADRKLGEVEGIPTRWNTWKADHPETKFMKYSPSQESNQCQRGVP